MLVRSLIGLSKATSFFSVLSMDEDMDSAVRTGDPSVWIEKTRIGGRDYKQEGPLRLGQAVYSPSQNRIGLQNVRSNA